MPYISEESKDKVDKGLVALGLSEFECAGDLNYAIHQLIAKYIDQNNRSYQTYNDIVGVLDCAKMELYRRLVSDYEDKKMSQNGDVAPYCK
jgi:hypothetical protein